MRKIFHLSLNVAGVLANLTDAELEGLIADDSGEVLSGIETRFALCAELAMGHYKLPIGEPCEGFDYGENGGCPGHPAPEPETENAAQS